MPLCRNTTRCCLEQWCKQKECCVCKYDGEKDIAKEVLSQKEDVFGLSGNSQRGFNLMLKKTGFGRPLIKSYQKLLSKLGYRGMKQELKLYSTVKNLSYLPPGGFLMWHTNEYDNNLVPYRIYLISVDRPGESAFKYQLHNGEIREVFDFHGAVRIFKNSHTNSETGGRSFLWHTIYSKSAHRQSIGFEIRPRELVALLDSCETCWELLRSHKSGNVSDSQK